MPDHQPTRIFISYTCADSDFVDRLEADMRACGFDAWVDRRRLAEIEAHYQRKLRRDRPPLRPA